VGFIALSVRNKKNIRNENGLERGGVKMTDAVYVGQGACKKVYSVTIREREVNEKGRVTQKSLNSMSFQIKDVLGTTSLEEIKKKLMRCMK